MTDLARPIRSPSRGLPFCQRLGEIQSVATGRGMLRCSAHVLGTAGTRFGLAKPCYRSATKSLRDNLQVDRERLD
jgi:hypothetical protein